MILKTGIVWVGAASVVASLALGLGGCVSVTEATPAAQNVRVISEQEARRCKFLDTISTHNNNTLSKDPHQDARNKAMNRVAELGGNALRITGTNEQASSSGVGSFVVLNGDAYKCS